MSTGPLLPLHLDGGGPLGRRLEAQLREELRRLEAGTKLPSTRALAADLGVSRGVVVGAYEQLAAEGYLVLRRGAAPLVADLPSQPGPTCVEEDVPVAGARHNLRPDLPDLSLFPRPDWLRASRAALARAADADLAYGEPFGAAELRHRLAPFLARTRGIASDSSRIGIHVGSTHALSVLARASGARRIAVEDPSHRWRRMALEAVGVDVVPVRVDELGLSVDDLPGDVDAVLLSPDHSFPLGVVLSPERRRALVGWATAHDALIVEHDYDAHFRYDRPPASALQALAPEHVAYVGSASALLAPTLRLGWSVLPERLVVPVARAMAESVFAVPRLEQFALAELIERGALDRHLRRARAAYKRRREIACAALPAVGAPVGLYVRVPVEDEALLLEALQARHVAVDGVQANAVGDCEPGLVVGFAASSEPALRRAVQLLRRML
jgi:GntR family transcriptional regulator / MocR family aminotransferase